MKPWLAVLIVALAAGYAGRMLFPVTERVISPPRIVTRYDTVQTVDTLWRSAWRERTRWDTLPPEIVTVEAAPETVYVMRPVLALTVLDVPQAIGDSTVAEGFRLTPADSGYLRTAWRMQWWTPGPFRAIDATVFPPRVAFWPEPKPVRSCGFFCRLSLLGAGAALGAAGWELAR